MTMSASVKVVLAILLGLIASAFARFLSQRCRHLHGRLFVLVGLFGLWFWSSCCRNSSARHVEISGPRLNRCYELAVGDHAGRIARHVRRDRQVISRCPLYPQKRTCAVQLGMSALCQERTSQPHSITASAKEITPGGMVRPSAFAVLRLITNSYAVACTTGRSAGFSPLRIRPT